MESQPANVIDRPLEEPTPFLATVAAGPREIRAARITIIVFAFIVAALVPFARRPAGELWAFIPSYESALALGDLITATLLLSQFARLNARPILVLGAAYLFSGVLAIAHMLSFPGLFSGAGLLGARSQTTVWLYMFWHLGFPLAVLSAMVMKPAQARNTAAAIWGTVAGVGLLAALCIVLATSATPLLPVLLDGGNYTPALYAVIALVWALTLAAIAAATRHKPRSVLDVWLVVVMCAWFGDVALSVVLNERRFDVGFYAGRIFGLVAANLVLAGLLLETGRLYAQLIDSLRSAAHEKELRLAQKEDARRAAEAASVAKSSFLASMSHEIRTPLNGVIGNLELLGQTGLDTEQTELIMSADNASKSLLALIGNILDFSKIEAGKLTIEMGEVDPVAIVEEAID
ncbi:MAG: MASE4 domain-containing protein, partial [Usitatibacter sp.]